MFENQKLLSLSGENLNSQKKNEEERMDEGEDDEDVEEEDEEEEEEEAERQFLVDLEPGSTLSGRCGLHQKDEMSKEARLQVANR